MKITVLDSVPLNPGDLDWTPLAAIGELTLYEQTAPEQTVERIADADIVYTNKVRIQAEHIRAASRLKLISVLATGYDIVDIDAARNHDVVVSNCPSYSAPSVAQATFALLLELTNHVAAHDTAVRTGRWQNAGTFCFWDRPLRELAGKTLVLAGAGAIGNQVGHIATALGMNVIAAILPDRPKNGGRWPRLPLAGALARADILSLHCPLTPSTSQLINTQRLRKMRDDALIINTARGGLIDESAVATALNAGTLAGYGTDVLSSEPPAGENPLLHAPNCIITPHQAWATLESRRRLLEISIANLTAFLAGSPQNVVNA